MLILDEYIDSSTNDRGFDIKEILVEYDRDKLVYKILNEMDELESVSGGYEIYHDPDEQVEMYSATSFRCKSCGNERQPHGHDG